MRTTNPRHLIAPLAGAAIAFVAGLAISQPATPAPPAIDATEMKKQAIAMMATKGQPTDQHKLLEPFAGTFDVDTRMFMGPGMPPMEAKSVTVAQWVLGNRFVEARATPAPGEDFPMSAIGYLGYDARKREFFWWGIDSTDTYSVFAQGGYDPDTKTFTLYGENLEPDMGLTMKFKAVFRVESRDVYTMAIRFEVPKELAAGLPADAIDAEGYATIMDLTANRRR
jgi:hypothetical protein